VRTLSTFLLSALLFIATAVTSHAQTATDLNEGCRMVKMPTANEYEFSWWGREGRAYFMQTSTDLVNWSYVPQAHQGLDEAIGYGFMSPTPRLFLRLRHVESLSAAPTLEDFDGDKITTEVEFSLGTDPLGWSDADSDGMPDDWELFYGLDAATDDSQLDLDDDGLANLLEFQLGLDATYDDTDMDGFPDSDEIDSGSNALAPQSTPSSNPDQAKLEVTVWRKDGFGFYDDDLDKYSHYVESGNNTTRVRQGSLSNSAMGGQAYSESSLVYASTEGGGRHRGMVGVRGRLQQGERL
jgi:hypothetical protein